MKTVNTQGKLITVLELIIRISLFLVFAIAGSGKFDSQSVMAENFIRWNLGIPIMFFVGFSEILGAVLLLFTKTLKYAIILLSGVMLGATGIHFLNWDEMGFPGLNLLLLFLLMLILQVNLKLLARKL
ncbi:DoxX family protein [Algoriphagus confluentis]|uniref:DoxX family protein n=1 Tax=Algoriphagus confluentis TaxID=1697556 RepID=A0ABQ6PU99_9BACT|nr:hypothetical protein Aconfl_41890 [Algoriphagus confluentis]